MKRKILYKVYFTVPFSVPNFAFYVVSPKPSSSVSIFYGNVLRVGDGYVEEVNRPVAVAKPFVANVHVAPTWYYADRERFENPNLRRPNAFFDVLYKFVNELRAWMKETMFDKRVDDYEFYVQMGKKRMTASFHVPEAEGELTFPVDFEHVSVRGYDAYVFELSDLLFDKATSVVNVPLKQFVEGACGNVELLYLGCYAYTAVYIVYAYDGFSVGDKVFNVGTYGIVTKYTDSRCFDVVSQYEHDLK